MTEDFLLNVFVVCSSCACFSISDHCATRKMSMKRVHNTKDARNEMWVEVYSRCCGYFTRRISRVLRLEPFRTRSGKITKSKGFSREKIHIKENNTKGEMCVGNSHAA